MNYIGLIVKNPFRNKTRTSLAIVGIAIGIATIVALGL
ncbi:MAG: ABC transporter permease, partial [Methanobacterium sp.]